MQTAQQSIREQSPDREVRLDNMGGKAHNLYHLQQMGFDVPDWFVVPADTYKVVSMGLNKKIERLLTEIDFTSYESIESASNSISELILSAPLPSLIEDGILSEIDRRWGPGCQVSVRSSVGDEDSSAHSFAGQMDSFLNVRSTGAIDAIRRVWASAYSTRALAYRHQKRIGYTDISVAVIIQRMIESACSGVMFTRDPRSKNDQVVLTAGYGLGEGVVQDTADTDTYIAAPNGIVLAEQVASKKTMVALQPEEGTMVATVAPSRSNRPVLSRHTIRQLVRVGKQVERCYEHPQDIEWAIDASGKLWLLQTRPIVKPLEDGTSAVTTVLDNSNIVESYPGITSPLTFSFIQQCYEISFRNASLGLIAFKGEVADDLPMFRRMIALIDGRVYYNLLNWYRMLSYLPGFQQDKKAWDQMIGITRQVPFPRTKLSWVNRLYVLVSVCSRLIGVKRTARQFFRSFGKAYECHRHFDPSPAEEFELIEETESLRHDFSRKWHLTLYNDFCAMRYYDWLKRLCGRWGLENYPNLHNDLLCGQPDVESVKPLHAILRIADIVRGNRELSSLFVEYSDSEIWKCLGLDTRFVQCKQAIDDYLQDFGDRGLEELKLETETYRDKPEQLIRLIRQYVATGLGVSEMEAKEQKVRGRAEKAIRVELRNRLKRTILHFVLKRARLAIANRENMRFARSRLYGLVRRLYSRMADRFVEGGVISQPADLYHLTVGEIENYVHGSSVTRNFKELVRLRRREYARFAASEPPERIITSGLPYHDLPEDDGKSVTPNGTLQGIGCSSGMAEGPAHVVHDPHSCRPDSAYILVARSTDPGWVFLMTRSKGIVVEKGSVLSHTAIIGRELGIPTVVGVPNATRIIKNGDRIQMNGATGDVRCL